MGETYAKPAAEQLLAHSSWVTICTVWTAYLKTPVASRRGRPISDAGRSTGVVEGPRNQDRYGRLSLN
jgi:hypothetical protein